jgi:hypothetical protein
MEAYTAAFPDLAAELHRRAKFEFPSGWQVRGNSAPWAWERRLLIDLGGVNDRRDGDC